ncbi:MAG: tetratricopeptide repeat protein, partial [Azoarcus sp.]|nr:tetratricopeptide repeat protein [Azoarcus sp.]
MDWHDRRKTEKKIAQAYIGCRARCLAISFARKANPHECPPPAQGMTCGSCHDDVTMANSWIQWHPPDGKELAMNRNTVFTRVIKPFFQNKGPLYKALVATALLLGLLYTGIRIYAYFFSEDPPSASEFPPPASGAINPPNPSIDGDCNNSPGSICQKGNGNSININQGPQPSLPNLEYLSDENAGMAKSYYEQRNYPKALEYYTKAFEGQGQALEAAFSKGETGEVQKRGRAD